MTARALLAELDAAGIRVSPRGEDGLTVESRPGVSIDPYRARIVAHKPALVALLGKGAEPIRWAHLAQGLVKATNVPSGWDGSLCAGCQWPALCGVLGPRPPHAIDGPCAAWPEGEAP
jgi:hypothetical protein